MHYEPTYESVHQHQLPKWYDDAKFGIFIHWSLFSVPAFAAEQTQTIAEQEDMSAMFANNPYAEWYLNSLRIPGSPTQAFHKKHFGDKSYFDFQKDFEEQNAGLDVHDWAKLIKKAGAKYCVLVTKHHDGYTLWPTDTPNPHIEGYYSKRDFVGELTDAIREEGLKMGLYYSGVYDWTFKTDRPIDGPLGFVDHQGMPEEYLPYSVAHFRELIDKYKPSILWNDIAFPYGYNLNELFAYYYNTVEDGVIDDRWNQIQVPKTEEEWKAFQAEGRFEEVMKNTTTHYDFITPEYRIFDEVQPYKWETTRGIGRSFGFNRTETGSDYLTGKQIIDMLVQVVSRNGNMLLNIGPRADGTIPFEQVKPLLEVGAWLEENGEAIYGTRPYTVPEVKDQNGTPICFTQTEEAVYAISLADKLEKAVRLIGYKVCDDAEVTLIGTGAVHHKVEGEDTLLFIPDDYKKAAAYTFKIKK
ncbi:MAG: alpha-L-fucosidase [Clostridiales bacterium]|nr:alpha-L-fucosidase [Clostridiales bacterium]